MKLILKAQSHPEIGDIPVEDSLFAIGRQEAPFNTHPNEAVAKLSRRHARIFEQDGHYFLVDSGSLNGTRLNGKALGQQAARLHQGDSINFAGQLEFRVELPPPQPSEPQPDIRLILTPCDPQAGLDRLVISRFPFLVSQNEGVFAGFPAALADEIRHLSRRHAHIFLKHGQPHIEDLGSTNGTFIGEQRLDEHALPLQSGDRLTFGSPALSYRVELPAEEPPPAPRADPVTTVAPDEADPRTTFITSASPFLDIFCQQQEPPRQATTADPAAAEQPPPPRAPVAGWRECGSFSSSCDGPSASGRSPVR
ncbi:FHA domain-containing protein [Marinobacterium aestuariivivens]|uniref:FHA domain-containing protein n=1 Tax=Marinobacterium aestuariivivens TaxID=1698799 RepID=A0ABW2A6C7_9GAMM